MAEKIDILPLQGRQDEVFNPAREGGKVVPTKPGGKKDRTQKQSGAGQRRKKG